MLDCSVECAKVAGRTLDVMLRYTCMCSIGIQLQNYCRMVVLPQLLKKMTFRIAFRIPRSD
jgi:hypothetical protein